MSDLIQELDELAEKAMPHETWVECSTPESDTKQVYTHGGEMSGEWVASFACIEDAAFAMALVNAWPTISKRLRAAEDVVKAAENEHLARAQLSQQDVDLETCSIEDRIDALADLVETSDKLTEALEAYRAATSTPTRAVAEEPSGER